MSGPSDDELDAMLKGWPEAESDVVAPDDADLLAYAKGQASPEVVENVERYLVTSEEGRFLVNDMRTPLSEAMEKRAEEAFRPRSTRHWLGLVVAAAAASLVFWVWPQGAGELPAYSLSEIRGGLAQTRGEPTQGTRFAFAGRVRTSLRPFTPVDGPVFASAWLREGPRWRRLPDGLAKSQSSGAVVFDAPVSELVERAGSHRVALLVTRTPIEFEFLDDAELKQGAYSQWHAFEFEVIGELRD